MDRPKWTDVAIVILTGGIVFLAFMQWREMHGAGEQTEKIIVAANIQASAANKIAEASDKNAAAAESFSRSAGAINTGVSGAVEKLQIQANETRELAKSALVQAGSTRDIAAETKEQNGLLRDQLNAMQAGQILQNRPWIKIKHSIVTPLTFNVGDRASGVPVALMTVADDIENVGQSVAVNVIFWEDVIPVDPDHSVRTAIARQREWCDANRHPDPRGLSGFTLFPHDPMNQQSIVGPQMPKVMAAAIRDESGLKVAFVLVGCVCYRASFDPQSSPTHQTRFMYWLGIPQNGAFGPYVSPQGSAPELRLIEVPDGLTAD